MKTSNTSTENMKFYSKEKVILGSLLVMLCLSKVFTSNLSSLFLSLTPLNSLFFDTSANDQIAINKNLLELREREKLIMITEEGAGPEPSERRLRKSSVASRDSRMSYVSHCLLTFKI